MYLGICISLRQEVSKYGVFCGLYFPLFGLNTERCFVFLHIQSECGKIRTRRNSVFGHISHSDICNCIYIYVYSSVHIYTYVYYQDTSVYVYRWTYAGTHCYFYKSYLFVLYISRLLLLGLALLFGEYPNTLFWIPKLEYNYLPKNL